MPNYITKQGLEDLKLELKDIVESKLPDSLDDINKALGEGDIKENSGLDAAKIDREKLISRQAEIDEILNDYELIDESGVQNSKTIQIGNTVKVEYLEQNQIFDIKIVGSSESDGINGKISNESPLAQAILGKKPGQETSFRIKNVIVKVKILEILS